MLEQKILEKSKEAFILAIEIYNKPSIKYRVEGFSFFICNAWELMLKAYMIKKLGTDSIYYKDNPARTITLENCLQKVFTNEKDPLRRNLSKIIDLRNTSTHFITEEYEMVYIPLFQACVFNFIEKMQSFHNIDMTEEVPQNFLTLSVSYKSFNIEEIKAKYSDDIANKLIALYNDITPSISANNNRFAICIKHDYYITKNRDAATTTVSIDNASQTKVKIVKELKDPNNTHKYSCKACCIEINKRLKRLNINLVFNNYHFKLFCQYYDIKNNPDFCYTTTTFTNPQHGYSITTIEFIVDEIKKDPDNIIQNLKNKLKK